MMLRSLSGRLTLLQQVLAGSFIILFAASSVWLTRHALNLEQTQFVESSARRLAGALDQELQEEGSLPRATQAMLGEESDSELRIDVYDVKGRLVGSTSPGATVRQTIPSGLYWARATTTSGATVIVSVSKRLTEATLGALGRALLVCAVPILLLLLALSHWTVQRTLVPLDAMGRRAHDASLGEGTRSLGPPEGVEETDRLQESFNRLLGRLGDLLESERRFTADASHELRTPLTVLSGEIEMALATPSLAPDIRAGLERAAREARGMNELVDALLLLRKTAEGRRSEERDFVPVNLSEVAANTLETLKTRYGERAGDVTAQWPKEVLVSGNAVLLSAALRNLFDNAFKFTSRGEPIRVEMVVSDQDVTVNVEDGGPGIPEEDKERIFDPFFRGGEARAGQDGFGLGLPLLSHVARAHDGSVVLERSSLGGACFRLRLPRWKGPFFEAAY